MQSTPQVEMVLLNSFALLNYETLLIIGAGILLLFGGSKIPQLMRGMGRGMGEFHTGVAEGKRSMEESMKAPVAKPEDTTREDVVRPNPKPDEPKKDDILV